MFLVPGGCTRSGGYLVWGGVPGLGECTWSRGDVPGPRGVYLVQGGLPGPGGVPGLGGVPGPRGCASGSGGVPGVPVSCIMYYSTITQKTRMHSSRMRTARA